MKQEDSDGSGRTDHAPGRSGSGLSEQLGACSEALEPYERDALSVLTDDWGTSTRDLGNECAKRFGRLQGFPQASRSAYWLNVMLKLERRGLVRRLDDLKPVAWQRVNMKREADGFTPVSDLVELPDGTVVHKDDV